MLDETEFSKFEKLTIRSDTQTIYGLVSTSTSEIRMFKVALDEDLASLSMSFYTIGMDAFAIEAPSGFPGVYILGDQYVISLTEINESTAQVWQNLEYNDYQNTDMAYVDTDRSIHVLQLTTANTLMVKKFSLD